MASNVVNLAALDVALLCPLCKSPWWPDTAVACPKCDCMFCRTCIEDYLAKNTTCSECHADVDVASYLRPPRELRSLSERTVIVRCPNRPDVCWSGPWGELVSHMKECPFDPSKVIYTGDVADELLCSICLHVLNDPETTSCCEQSFCKACIRGALSRKPECPHCRHAHPEELLREPRASLLRILGRLEVICPAKCGWTGERTALQAHVASCTGAPAAAAAPVAPAVPRAPAAVVADPVVVATEPVAAAAAPITPPVAHVVAVPVVDSTSATSNMQLEAINYHPTVHESDGVVPFTTMAHITAPKPSAALAANRKDLQISAVMDISGSMRGEKLRLAKEALSFVVEELRDDDRFGLIAFDDRVEETMAPTSMSRDGKARARSSIQALSARGSTNLSGGLFAGIAQARDLPFVPSAESVPSAHVDPAASNAAPPPATGIMGRLMAFASGNRSNSRSSSMSSSVPPPPPVPAFVKQPASVHQPRAAPVAEADAEVSIPPFDMVVKCNASPVKINSVWSARYNFVGDVPSSVAPRVTVSVRSANGNVGNLRSGTATFNETNNTFKIQICVGPIVRASFDWTIDTEAGTGEMPIRFQGYQAAMKKQRSRIVLLFTDGVANCGIIDASALVAKTKDVIARVPDKDVVVFTFGFGENHNGSLLQQVAELSQGSYYYVKSNAQMVEVFADCIGGLLSMVATNLHLTIRPALGVRIKTVMTQFPTEDGTNYSKIVRIKDLYAEEERDVGVELEIAPRRCGGAAPLVTWELTCENVVLGRQETVTATSTAPTVADAFTGAPDMRVDQQIGRYMAAAAMREAQVLADSGRVAEANLRLNVVQQAMRQQPSAGTAYHQTLCADMDRAVQATESVSVWQSQGQKNVNRMRTAHVQQRANTVDEDDDCNVYMTSAKKESRAKCKK